MKSLVDYIKEEVACSLGTMMDNSTFMTPGQVMGIGDPKPPTPEEPGSGDLFGTTRKDKPKNKNKKKEKN